MSDDATTLADEEYRRQKAQEYREAEKRGETLKVSPSGAVKAVAAGAALMFGIDALDVDVDDLPDS